MSNAHKCERCGAFGAGEPAAELSHDARLRQHRPGDVLETDYELCADCALSFVDWFGQRGGQ